MKRTRWFIKNFFSITYGRNGINRSVRYISVLRSLLEMCQNGSESSCTSTTLIDFPRLPQGQLCDFTVTASLPSPEYQVGETNSSDLTTFPASSIRSSRNAHGWNPEEFHRQASEKALKFQSGKRLQASVGKQGSPPE